MTLDPPPLDLLVVGGLTIDRFADGSSGLGGSVMHVARAAAGRGLRLGVVTASGREPEARLGVEELRRLAAWVESSEGATTMTFRHAESAAGRRLWLERSGGSVHTGVDARERIVTNAVLFGPLADEIAPAELATLDEPGARGAILQGWLRSADEGEVRPIRLAALQPELVENLRRFDLLVASREDLLAEARDPLQQLLSLRQVFGRGPTLIVTDGPDGIWMCVQQSVVVAEPQHLPVPRRVEGVSTVGSGDVFAAFMLAGDWEASPGGAFLSRRAELAMGVVVDVLEARRTDRG
jgi:sugar/nucleoside kinase (ribokinase family)